MRRTTLLLLLGAAAPSMAQTPPDGSPMRGPGPGMAGMAMRADANGDGIVTREEALAEAGARFDRMDANRDGRLDKDELTRFRPARRSDSADAPPPPRD